MKWNVRVNTSDIPHAGTDADVYVLLTGELKNGRLKESEKIILDNSSNNFERNQCDQFTIETYDYANLTKLRIGHNNKSLGSAWHLNKASVLENIICIVSSFCMSGQPDVAVWYIVSGWSVKYFYVPLADILPTVLVKSCVAVGRLTSA